MQKSFCNVLRQLLFKWRHMNRILCMLITWYNEKFVRKLKVDQNLQEWIPWCSLQSSFFSIALMLSRNLILERTVTCKKLFSKCWVLFINFVVARNIYCWWKKISNFIECLLKLQNSNFLSIFWKNKNTAKKKKLYVFWISHFYFVWTSKPRVNSKGYSRLRVKLL